MKETRVRRRPSLPLAGLAALALLVGAPSGRARGEAQAPPTEPSSEIPRIPGGRVERVTVDVVVLDRKGQPVTGLGRDDFTILDEGLPETIASFDVIDRTPRTESAPSPESLPRVSTNAGTRAPSFAIPRSSRTSRGS